MVLLEGLEIQSSLCTHALKFKLIINDEVLVFYHFVNREPWTFFSPQTPSNHPNPNLVPRQCDIGT